MGFVLLGIGAIDSLGISGAMLQMISHGLIAAAMFFITGAFYERSNTLSIPNMGGLAEVPWLKRRRPGFVWSIRSLLVASVLLTVLILAKRKFDRERAPLLVNVEQSTVRPVANTDLVSWAKGRPRVAQVMKHLRTVV